MFPVEEEAEEEEVERRRTRPAPSMTISLPTAPASPSGPLSTVLKIRSAVVWKSPCTASLSLAVISRSARKSGKEGG